MVAKAIINFTVDYIFLECETMLSIAYYFSKTLHIYVNDGLPSNYI